MRVQGGEFEVNNDGAHLLPSSMRSIMSKSASCSTSHATGAAKSACVTLIRLRDDETAEARIKAPRRRGCAGDKMQI